MLNEVQTPHSTWSQMPWKLVASNASNVLPPTLNRKHQSSTSWTLLNLLVILVSGTCLYLTTSLTQKSTGHIPSSSGLGALHGTFIMTQGESHNLSYCSRHNGVHSKCLLNENEEQETALDDLWRQVLPTPVASFLHIKTGKYVGTDRSQVART